MVHSDVRIPLTVTSVQPETPGYLSIYFERPPHFEFEPGNWMDIALPADQPAGGTTYSFASSPHDPELRITFREGLSPFKKVLASTKPGDSYVITQYGNDNGFKLDEHYPCVLIAGGVGIAPFRSMLKDLIENRRQHTVQLIYLNTTDAYLYRDDLDSWEARLSNLSIHYIATKVLKRKDKEKLLGGLLPGPDHRYYISGPTAMVTHTLKLLKEHRIFMKSIKIDDFGHY